MLGFKTRMPRLSERNKYHASFEDEKTNSKLKNFIQYNIHNEIYKYQNNPLLNISIYPFRYSPKLLNDNETKKMKLKLVNQFHLK